VKKLFLQAYGFGLASAPNTFNQVQKIIEKEQFGKLVLRECPWCNTEFKRENYIVRSDSFNFTCTNSRCDFGRIKNNVLPCNIIDDALYKNPPSLLIATVDKFARLAWEERAVGFFGKNGNRPPELIIQDELHLISSALGSIVGLYEVAIDTVLISRGMRAKYIASSATIKNAKKQIQALFARKMTIFPSPGIRHDDSYFAKMIPLEEKPGRLYIGYLAPLLSRQQCLEPLAGILLSGPVKLFKDRENLLDKWWTQVVYHGSLRGVGNSRTLYQSGAVSYLNKMTIENINNDIEEDCPSFFKYNKKLESLDGYKNIEDLDVKTIVDKYLPVRNLNIKTLTSNQSAEENTRTFDALVKEKEEIDAIDVVLATNMISVGLDVSRLALMVINGQPLTTAEYIQASSRVGRSETPGIVFTNYYKTQARSLSHYENFKSYHNAFYRFVEPSSLTPFTYQARTRALHAALIIAVRYSNIGLISNESAGDFDSEDEFLKKIIKNMKIRCSLALGNEKETINKVYKHIDELVSSWQQEADYSRENQIRLVYNSKDRGFNNLICNFDEKNGLWQTLQSMRNVEDSALVKLLKGVKEDN
jgi:helicase-like protein